MYLLQRADRVQANLDASEASNRQLLITLEEDRKTIRRLVASQAKKPDVKTLSNEIDMLRQELEQERTRCTAAELRAKRVTSKLCRSCFRLNLIAEKAEAYW